MPAIRTTRAPRNAPAGRPPPGTLRVHLASDPGEADAYALDAERFARAGEAFPETFARLRPSYSHGEDAFVEGVRDADVLIGWRFPRNDLGQRAPALRWIQLIGAGVDHLAPFDWLPPGVALCTASGVHTRKAFEYSLMALVALNARLPAIVDNQHRRVWKRLHSGSIRGKTALVIGLGAVGTGAAEAARTLGMRVLGARRTARRHRFVDESFGIEDLDRALPRADYVVLAAPLTDRTRGLVGRREIAMMKEGAGVVNLGRGALIVQEDLEDALEAGRLGGAFLDVATPEPLPAGARLWSAPGAILTPHVSSDDVDEYVALVFGVALANMERFFAGKRLRNVVSLRHGY